MPQWWCTLGRVASCNIVVISLGLFSTPCRPTHVANIGGADGADIDRGGGCVWLRVLPAPVLCRLRVAHAAEGGAVWRETVKVEVRCQRLRKIPLTDVVLLDVVV